MTERRRPEHEEDDRWSAPLDVVVIPAVDQPIVNRITELIKPIPLGGFIYRRAVVGEEQIRQRADEARALLVLLSDDAVREHMRDEIAYLAEPYEVDEATLSQRDREFMKRERLRALDDLAMREDSGLPRRPTLEEAADWPT